VLAPPDRRHDSQNLRVTANTAQNAVTVLAEKPCWSRSAKQIRDQWDIIADPITPRVTNQNSDP